MKTVSRWVRVDNFVPGWGPAPDGWELRMESRKVATRALTLRREAEAIRERSVELCRRAQPVIEQSLALRRRLHGSHALHAEGEIAPKALDQGVDHAIDR